MNRWPLEGIECWRNPKNKFFIFKVHYSANPAKKDPAYRENVKSAMPIRQYMQEYELQWESYAGTPVYPDFQRSIHGSKTTIEPVLGLPLLRGWDFGLTPACVVAQYVNSQLRVLCEFTALNKGAEQFSSEVLAQCRIRFPHFGEWKDCIDPSGAFRKDTDMGTCAGILAKKGLAPVPGPVAFEERRTAVEHFLTRYTKSGPSFQISLADCPTLVRGFEGGYRYDEKAIDVEPQKVRPIKDEHSHCFPAGTLVSTPLGDRAIEILQIGDEVKTPFGSKKITATMNSEVDHLIHIQTRAGRSLLCTPNHPIWSEKGFVRADELRYGSALCAKSTPFRNLMVSAITRNPLDITKQILASVANICIAPFGSFTTNPSLKGFKSIIKTKIDRITPLRILRSWMLPFMQVFTERLRILSGLESTLIPSDISLRNGMLLIREESGTANTQDGFQKMLGLKTMSASSARKTIQLSVGGANAVFVDPPVSQQLGEDRVLITKQEHASTVKKAIASTNTLDKDFVVSLVREKTDIPVRVYDLTVEDAHCFYANGILVSNCHDALQYICATVKKWAKWKRAHVPSPQYFPANK